MFFTFRCLIFSATLFSLFVLCFLFGRTPSMSIAVETEFG